MSDASSPEERSDKIFSQKRAKETRERIIIGAATVFETSGYAATSINEIIDAGTSTKGALYYHFPTKSSVACEIAERWAEATYELEQQIWSTANSPLDQLYILSRSLTHLGTHSPLYRAGLKLSTEVELDTTPRLYYEWEKRIENIFDDAITAGQIRKSTSARLLASNYCAMLIGLFHSPHTRHTNDLSVENQFEDFLQTIILGKTR